MSKLTHLHCNNIINRSMARGVVTEGQKYKNITAMYEGGSHVGQDSSQSANSLPFCTTQPENII